MPDDLSGNITESLLTALAYAGDEAALLFAVVDPSMFDGIYKDVATRLLEFRVRFKKPPAPAHLDDIFDYVLDDPNHKHYRAYTRIIVGMREQAPSLNIKYLIDRVVSFARRQKLKDGVARAGDRYMQGGDGMEDEVEKILYDTLRQRVETADYGERLSSSTLSFLDQPDINEGDQVRTGILPLDRRGLVPTRGEMLLLMGRRKSGKSFFLQYLARQAARQRWNVVHISLENRQSKVKMRYVQSWFAVAKRKEPFVRAEFLFNKDGQFGDIDYEVMEPPLSFDDPRDKPKLVRRVQKHSVEMGRVVVKEWPSGFLTLQHLERWLDGLEASEGTVPDMIVFDYPQLMKLDARDLRVSLGHAVVGLRGLAGERNMALCTVVQSNRTGETAKLLRAEHAAEDISQIATADTVLTYNQTEAERRAGLARLHVAAARNDDDKFTILISQAYKTGQFHLDSVQMPSSYWDMLTEVDSRVQKERLSDNDQFVYVDEPDAED